MISNIDLIRMRVLELETLPEHDPERYETADSYGTPEVTNGDSAEAAADMLETLDVDEIEDAITNLLHLAHSRDPEGVQDVLSSALMHFLAEAGPL